MSCGEAGKKKSVYTGNQTGALNYVGPFNYVAGGPNGSGLSAGTTVINFIPSPDNRRVWLRKDAVLDDKLLDAAFPIIDLQWFCEIEFDAETTFRFSDRAFYVLDEAGEGRFVDARAERAPSVSVSVGEWLAQNYEVGDTSLSLNNRDGYFNPYLPMGEKYRQWTGVRVRIFVGFGDLRSNYHMLFEGTVTEKGGLSTTRDTVEIKCHDRFEQDEVPLPPRTFSSDNFPEIDDTFANKQVPLVYGDWTEEVPSYGAINAICTNALEANPEKYDFKISDVALQEIQAVFLHRGERTADKVGGPIKISDNVLIRDEDSGEFSIPSSGVVLDEPYYIANRIKAGPGSFNQLITSDNGFNFVEQGVKVGDTVVNGAPTQSKVILGNLEFKATAIGADGNGIGIEYYFLDPSEVDSGAKSKSKCYASLSGNTIRVGITRYTDSNSVVQIGKHTAGAIKSAINESLACNALVRIGYVGTVPFGYPENTRVSEVDQNVPAGPVYTAGGQNAGLSATIFTVSNFQITVSGTTVFAPGTEFSISTVQYKFLKSDKFTCLVRGKGLNLVSVDRLSDINTSIRRPNGLAVDFDQTYWFCDDETQKVYKLSFDKQILREIPYASIHPSITKLSGVAIGTDNTLWVTAPDQSKIFRYGLPSNQLGLVIDTRTVTGLGVALGNLQGISLKPDGKLWILDQATHQMFLLNPFSGTNPYVERTLDTRTVDAKATEPLDLSYDDQTGQLTFADRATNSFYRVNETTGALISALPFTDVASNVSFVSGACIAQDGTIMLVDQGTLSVYNYNDMADASNNPAIIARDLLQKFGGHTYEEFDLSWMETARQLTGFRSRAVFDKKSTLVKEINKLLGQYNTAFFLRFNRFAIMYIHFDNFKTTGKTVGEKDIKADTFKPGKETNQYFNSANANFGTQPFNNKSFVSDTYVSTSAISFAGREVQKTLEMPSVYRRKDLDKLLPLHVRLSAPEPEFIEATLCFRVIRAQMQDFLSLTFNDDVLTKPGQSSGRRFTSVPCMIRKMTYDLGPMTVSMKLWSLGSTGFAGYTPPGRTVGGQTDQILLSSVGRPGRISPTGTILSAGTDRVTLVDVNGQDAEHRANGAIKAWIPGYRVALVDGETKDILQTLTIKQVNSAVVIFEEAITATVSPTVKNSDGFTTGGTMLQYANHGDQSQAQKELFACFSKPSDNYPTSRTQELEEQRGGLHNFADGSLPYILYPIDFVASE